MKKLIAITALLLLVLILPGCQLHSENTPEQSPSQPDKTTGPLTLQVTSPFDGRETMWGFTTVNGIVSHPEAIVTVNGIGVEIAEDGSFDSDYILLSEGKNELTATATLNGEKVSETVTVTYTLKLHVSISLNLAPGEDWLTESPAEISGRVSDPRADVTVNSKKAVVGEDGRFTIVLELMEGINALTAIARLGDQIDRDTREAIYVRPVSLTLDIVAPEDGEETPVDLVKVTGTVSDPEAKVFVHDAEALVTTGGAFYAYLELDEGDNLIDTVAIRGNEKVVDTIHITYHPPDTAPAEKLTLRVAYPQHNAEYRVNVLPVTGTVSDPTAVVLVNGVEAMMAADGSFKCHAVLKEGENNIEVIAVKDVVKTTQDITVTFNPALVVYLNYPSAAQDVDYTKEPLTIGGWVNKPEAMVSVNDQSVPVAPDGNFTTQVMLEEGSSVMAVATIGGERDEAGGRFTIKNGSPVPIPGVSLFFVWREKYEHEVTLKAGETKRFLVTIETRKDGPGKFYGKLVHVEREYGLMPLPLPKGLDIYLEPAEFMAYPNTTYNIDLVLEATPELAPGTYFLHLHHNLENIRYGSGWLMVTVE
jgi:nitrogen fixation protein FixH